MLGINMNLLQILNSSKYKDIITHLRQSDAIEQKHIKENQLPCYTVAGLFSRRNNNGLIHSSGLAAVDLDSAENYDIFYLLQELKKIDSIAYAGTSCRGERLFCIVPFLYPDQYLRHYNRLIKSFNDFGLPMGDDCHKRISQPRLVSWNDESTQFFNHFAKPYHLLEPERKYCIVNSTPNNRYHAKGIPEDTFQWCTEQIYKRFSFKEGGRHEYIIKLARYCNLKGLPENEAIKGCLEYICDDFSEKEIKGIIKHVYITHIDSYNKFPYRQFKATGAGTKIYNAIEDLNKFIK